MHHLSSCLSLACLLAVATPTSAATFTVTNTADAGAGSLRQAILDANANAGADLIDFNIPAATDAGCNAPTGVCTIQPVSSFPVVTDTVMIDGYTQPGAVPNMNPPTQGTNAVLKVELDANFANAAGLNFFPGASSSSVRGLAINRFGGFGIELSGNEIAIQGNFFGTDVTGFAIKGGGGGVRTSGGASQNVIGTDGDGANDAAERNILSGHNAFGVVVAGGVGNVVAGNLIGTNASGSVALGNQFGVATGDGNLIGTDADGMADAAERNIISGNSIEVQIASPSDNNVVAGNYIGTDITGTVALSGGTGVNLSGFGNRIGTDGDGIEDLSERNVISAGSGVTIFGVGTEQNVVAGNYIGTEVTGTQDLGNLFTVSIGQGASNNTIGGSATSEGNIIAFGSVHGVSIDGANNNEVLFNSIFSNAGAGVAVTGGGASTGNSILGNSIYSNARGIDLGNDGVTPNDPDDNDSGPNNLQNFPVITFAGSTTSTTEVSGTLNSTSSTTFTVDFFSNDNCHVLGHGEGETPLGSAPVTTDGTGTANFSVVLSAAAPVGSVISATATDPDGNTSEFSECGDPVTTLDADGDGIPNDLDLCPISDLSPTVVVGGCDSGVNNVLLGNGCTIADLIAECAANAIHHGEFTKCVSDLTNDLKAGGIISGMDKGAIQSCAAGSSIP